MSSTSDWCCCGHHIDQHSCDLGSEGLYCITKECKCRDYVWDENVMGKFSWLRQEIYTDNQVDFMEIFRDLDGEERLRIIEHIGMRYHEKRPLCVLGPDYKVKT